MRFFNGETGNKPLLLVQFMNAWGELSHIREYSAFPIGCSEIAATGFLDVRE